jgi:outer membrane protein assembly factor BamB
MPAIARETVEQPRELPPGVWEPPPVRRGDVGKDKDTSPAETAPASETHQPRVTKRRAWLGIAGLFLFLLIVFGGLGVWVYTIVVVSEENLLKEARGYYKDNAYGSAAEKFHLLAEKFPQSDQADEYRFLDDWCTVCSTVATSDADPAASLPDLDRFVKNHKEDPLMSKYAQDAGQQLLRLARRFAERNANPPDDQPLKTAEQIERLRRTVAGLGPEALTKEETASIDAALDKVRRNVERANKRRSVLAQIRKGDKETWMDAIKRVGTLLARRERDLPGIKEDAEVRTALDALYQGHLDSVQFHWGKQGLPRRPDDDADSPEDDPKNTIVFAPQVGPAAPGNAPPKDPIVLALVRGVLYALKQSNGAVKWAMRVGTDTTALPLRVPIISPANPEELWLVLSADAQTLFALNAEGKCPWEYSVGSRVLGRPIIIDRRAYLAAYDGWIHEIELLKGELVGRWYVGQPLTCGGAREGQSSRIYFPAEDSCTYVLDVKTHSCVAILYDGHRSGSLRSEPVIVPPVGDAGPGYLILNEASGLDAMQLQVFELPVQERHAAPLTLKTPARLDGWTWFEPSQDGEKLAVLSDAGLLGLFGIRQLGNRDQPLFPLLPKDDPLPKERLLPKYGLDLSRFLLKEQERELPRERGRSQVVHMRENDFWVLAHGRLQQVHVGWKWTRGPQAAAAWKEPLTLGSPLHEPQCLEDRNTGHSTFFLVTQALKQQTCLATAVDEQGQIRWQRQLGLVCQGTPLALTPPEGGQPMLVALDQSGGLFALDPLRPQKPQVLAEALDENPRVPPCLLPSPDGHSAYEVAAPGDGHWLIVRRIDWVNGTRELRVLDPPIRVTLMLPDQKTLYIPSGQPAIVGTQLVVPMMDGTLTRLSLVEEQKGMKGGPPWRDDLAPATASCHVLALGGDRFLVTDGSRGLRMYEWPAAMNKVFRPLLPKGEEAFPRLEYPVVSPPVLLPSSDGRQRIAVADSVGVLHLFTVAPDGSLQSGLTWDLQGKITMGPFVHTTPRGEVRLGCVVDRSSLVWIDPEKKESLWTYPSGGAAIIGPPTQTDDLLVVALQSGHYVGLDPETGQPKGRGYTLRTSAAPAAPPMPFDAGRIFTPLSDGTALLLPVELLRKPAKK